jgi:hypothetical protein
MKRTLIFAVTLLFLIVSCTTSNTKSNTQKFDKTLIPFGGYVIQLTTNDQAIISISPDKTLLQMPVLNGASRKTFEGQFSSDIATCFIGHMVNGDNTQSYGEILQIKNCKYTNKMFSGSIVFGDNSSIDINFNTENKQDPDGSKHVSIPVGNYKAISEIDNLSYQVPVTVEQEKVSLYISNLPGGDGYYILGQFVNENISKTGTGTEKACYVGDDFYSKLKYFNITHCVYDESSHVFTGKILTSIDSINGISIKFRTAPGSHIVIPANNYVGNLKVDNQLMPVNVNIISELDTVIYKNQTVGSYDIVGIFIYENINTTDANNDSTCFVGTIQDMNNEFHSYFSKTVININDCRYVNGIFTGTIKLKDPIFNITDITFKSKEMNNEKART